MIKDKGSLCYNEKKDKLKVRIEAHKRFSNFSLEDWIDENFSIKQGDVILDIGCGSGNLFSSYSKKLGTNGLIVGSDKSSELLSEAQQKSVETPTLLLEWDFNNKFPFIEGMFDYIISTFAVYYADNHEFLLKEMKRLLKSSGKVFFIGPSDNNAKELYDFNKKIFGFGRDEKITRRTNRLEKEFYPAFKETFKNVTLDTINSKLTFPTSEEFISYYQATLLFEESIKKYGVESISTDTLSAEVSTLKISKEMIVLCGEKI